MFSNNRLVETCCCRTKIVCCEQICRRSVNKLAADLIKTTRDRSVGTDCNNLLISTDLLQVVISDLLSLVSNRLVASCFNKLLRLCCQQLATDLFPQTCYRLTKRNQQTCRDPVKSTACDMPVRFLAVYRRNRGLQVICQKSFKNTLKKIVTTHLEFVFMFLVISFFTFPLDLKKLPFFWLKIVRLDLDKNLT